jgi:predicted ArsR family transcriptional regulator
MEKQGQGDLQIADVMTFDPSKANNLFRKRFTRYQTLVEEIGEAGAYDAMMKHYPQQQKALMGTFIDSATLAAGFTKAIPLLKLMGFETQVIDVSQNGIDAALEIQSVCPFMALAQEYKMASPCQLFCEMEQEAARRAFAGLKASILTSQQAGSCVCVFKYERPAQRSAAGAKITPGSSTSILSLVRLIPTFAQVGFRLLRTRLSP